ncbi:hypothetical protein RBB78_08295 [Tunturiibacter empetritectus]
MERKNRWGVPWVSLAVCSVGWALALRLSFERLISIDLVLYGAALMLEFVALVVLRVKEPGLARPFKVPGGVWGAVGMGVGPAVLIGFALWAARGNAWLGCRRWSLRRLWRRRGRWFIWRRGWCGRAVWRAEVRR